jgi:hypothetical protein
MYLEDSIHKISESNPLPIWEMGEFGAAEIEAANYFL